MKANRFRTALTIAILFATIACREPRPDVAPEGFVEVPGGRVFYTTMGNGDKTPLLLLHGGPGGRSCGFSVLRDLAADRRVIRYDQLGSGQSDRPADLNLSILHGIGPEDAESARTSPARPVLNSPEQVARWDLDGVWPVRYSGPRFSSSGTAAAIETIELAHTGFHGVV